MTQRADAGDVGSVGRLTDAAEDDLVHAFRRQPRALAQAVVELCQQRRGRQRVKGSVWPRPATGAAYAAVDESVIHAPAPVPTPRTRLAQVVVLPPTLKVSMFSAPSIP